MYGTTLFVFSLLVAVRMGVMNMSKMKQQIVLLAMLLSIGCATAQDIIYTTDGQSIEARNITHEGNAIRYSLYSASIMDRSTYMLDLSRVKKINYEDGHTYDPKAKSEPAPTRTAHASTVKQTQIQNSRDTVVVYANMQPNKQFNSRLFNAYPPYKNPSSAFVRSLAIPGLGQLYNDEVENGLWFMGGDVVFIAASTIAYVNQNYTVAIIGLAGSFILRVISSVEAATRSNELNNSRGYLTIAPTLQQSNLAMGDCCLQIIPSVAMTLGF